jgi:hypothetical protein
LTKTTLLNPVHKNPVLLPRISYCFLRVLDEELPGFSRGFVLKQTLRQIVVCKEFVEKIPKWSSEELENEIEQEEKPIKYALIWGLFS